MTFQQAISDLQGGIGDTIETAAIVTGNAIATGLAPVTSATTTIVGGFTSTVSGSVTSLSDSLYDAENQSGILYDIRQGVNGLGTNISTGLAATSSAVDEYTVKTGEQISTAATFILIGLCVLAVALFVNAYTVNRLDKTLKVA